MSDSQTTLTVDEFGVRLDKRLTTQFDYSRSFFVHLFDREAISVRGKTAKKSYKTRPGDKVTIESLDRFVDGGILDEAPAIDLPVHHETDDYLVLYKPKGVLSHPNSIRDVGQPSVVGFLYHRYRDLPSIGNFIRAGLIHRLDRETDGLMLAAKTEAGMAYFKNLFLQKSQADTINAKDTIPLKKYYRALCDITSAGQNFLQKLQGSSPLLKGDPAKHERDYSREGVHIIDADVIPRTPYPVVKRGITKILSCHSALATKSRDHGDAESSTSDQDPGSSQGGQRALIHLEILTGRTHQIRYHLSSIGLPIVGDYLYHDDHNEDEKLSLTAHRLTFTDLYGEHITCTVA